MSGRRSRPVIVQAPANERSILLSVIESEVAAARERLGVNAAGRFDAYTHRGGLGAIIKRLEAARSAELARKHRATVGMAVSALRRMEKARAELAAANEALASIGLMVSSSEKRGHVVGLVGHERQATEATALVEAKAKRDALTDVLDEARAVAVGPESGLASALVTLRDRIRKVVGDLED